MLATQPVYIHDVVITDKEFSQFSQLIYKMAGITMADTKKGLVKGRLAKRLRYYNLKNFTDYYRLVSDEKNVEELQIVVDLLTTNETYFFREEKHFELIKEINLTAYKTRDGFDVWSAACSSGEEPYSIAMQVCSEIGMDSRWNILATDLNQEVLMRAQRGLYSMDAAKKIPREFLEKYCLEGTGRYSGSFLISKPLRDKIKFRSMNLNGKWDAIGLFDLIFLRNVMIYFDKETKARLIERMAAKLKPDGYLVVSHAETLTGVSDKFRSVRPSVYKLK